MISKVQGCTCKLGHGSLT